MLIGGILLVILTGMWLFSKPSTSPAGTRPTAIIWTASPTPTPTSTPTPTPPPTPLIPPTEIGVGVRVQISGTGAAGLSIRASASTSAERLDVAAEGEIFIVAAGPAQGDDLTWWFLRDEANPQREGWAAADYLVIAP
ncbi:MAG: SH3 domain-containing protein [Anaerolineae bacterium]|nr:SH3 domain-containing protein [Anaerolineae bacterium]